MKNLRWNGRKAASSSTVVGLRVASPTPHLHGEREGRRIEAPLVLERVPVETPLFAKGTGLEAFLPTPSFIEAARLTNNVDTDMCSYNEFSSRCSSHM